MTERVAEFSTIQNIRSFWHFNKRYLEEAFDILLVTVLVSGNNCHEFVQKFPFKEAHINQSQGQS